MNTIPDFHGSDIEKVCEYYGLNKDTIINFGAERQSPWPFPPCKRNSRKPLGSALFLSRSGLSGTPKCPFCILSDSR